MSLQFFSRKSSDYDTIILPKKEYTMVMSELDTRMSDKQRGEKV